MSVVRAALVFVLLARCAHAQDEDRVGFGFAYSVATDRQPVVTAVAAGGAAEAAGLAPGDSLLRADDEPLVGLTATEVGAAIDRASSDAPVVTYHLIRNGRTLALEMGKAPYEPDALLRDSRTFYCREGDCLDGIGVWRAPDGERYTGAFRDGWRHGDGTLVLANGDLYVGTFRRGEIEGSGTYVWSDGGRYTGDIWGGGPHGRGVRTYADGSVYTGKFVDRLRHGSGTLRRPDGSYWTGLWKDGAGVRGAEHAADGSVLREGALDE